MTRRELIVLRYTIAVCLTFGLLVVGSTTLIIGRMQGSSEIAWLGAAGLGVASLTGLWAWDTLDYLLELVSMKS